MPTVREILEASGVDTYEINSISPQVTGAFERVLQEAQSQKQSVDEFWANTYNPGVTAWESERAELARKAAQAEAKAAYFERERESLKQSGLVTDDAPFSSRSTQGQFTTPGTPSFSGDPNEFVGRAAQGLATIADIDWRHRSLYGKPMEIAPSALIAEADRLGISPSEFAERKFSFSKREGELQVQRQKEAEERIRQDERSKIAQQYSDGSGSINPMAHNGSMASIRRAQQAGERKDPLTMTQEQRRAAALAAIHKHVEERAEREG